MGLRTPLYDRHQAAGARIVDFAGWDMPVIYKSIVEEHRATRTAAGLFDICHMGRLRWEGPDVVQVLDRLITNRVDNLKMGQARYALVLNEAGGMLDDILITRFEDHYLMVVNASNRAKLLDWFAKHLAGTQTKITDLTADLAMIACQGPKALELAQPLFDVPLASIKYYFASPATYAGKPAIVSRTGYTGEDGIEALVPASLAGQLWDVLVAAGATPAGLGARDTLRLEAGMPLYGHELDENTDPLQAGLGWAVKSADKDFIGKAALPAKPEGRPVRVGLRLADKRIARENFAVHHNGAPVGRTTSGTFGPTVDASIAMAYVSPSAAAVGADVQVEIRSQLAPATVVELPFYRRGK